MLNTIKHQATKVHNPSHPVGFLDRYTYNIFNRMLMMGLPKQIFFF